MADEYLWQMTQLVGTPAAADGIYIGDASEPVLDDQNKYILVSDMIAFLSGGNWQGDIVLDAAGTLDLQNGTVWLNENVDLTATSTQLNAVGSGTLQVGDTSVVVADPGTGTVTITADATTVAVFQAVDTQLYDGGVPVFQTHLNAGTNAGFDVFNETGVVHMTVRCSDGANTTFNSAEDGGLMTFLGNDSGSTQRNLIRADPDTGVQLYHNGNERFDTTADGFDARPDADGIFALGRVRIGYDGTNSDTAHFAHYDFLNATDYSIRHNSSGGTIVNSALGQAIQFRINNVNQARMNTTGTLIEVGELQARSDTDTAHTLGRARIGFATGLADNALFAHIDQMTNTNYALRQNAAGATFVNAVAAQVVSFEVNSAPIFDVSASGLAGTAGARITQFDNDDTLAADSATRVPTQAAVKGYVDGQVQYVTLEVYSPTTAASTGNDLIAFVVPPKLNGYDLTNVIVGVYVLGVGGTQDVMIHRRRAGANVDMLSAAVTIDPAEYFAQDGTIDTSNDDVQTGDTVVVDIDAVHSTTPADGTFVTLEFTLP